MRGKWFAPTSGGYRPRDPGGRLAARGPGRPPKIPATPEGVRAAAALEAEHKPTGGLHAFMGVICCCGSLGTSHAAHLAEVLAESLRNLVPGQSVTRIWGRDEALGDSPFAANVWAGSPEDIAKALVDAVREHVAVEIEAAVREQIASKLEAQADRWADSASRHRADALRAPRESVRAVTLNTARAFRNKAAAMRDAVRIALGDGVDGERSVTP